MFGFLLRWWSSRSSSIYTQLRLTVWYYCVLHCNRARSQYGWHTYRYTHTHIHARTSNDMLNEWLAMLVYMALTQSDFWGLAVRVCATKLQRWNKWRQHQRTHSYTCCKHCESKRQNIYIAICAHIRTVRLWVMDTRCVCVSSVTAPP